MPRLSFRPGSACVLAAGAALLIVAGTAAVRGADPADRGRDAAPPAPGAAPHGRPAGLPLPSTGSVAAYEAILFPFLNDRTYVALGWEQDGVVRDTGPYLNGKYYGTHPAVRVWYSPEVIEWLKAGRVGALPDGAMVVKEQYDAPAARHAGKTEEELRASLQSWTVMVKDSNGSRDGWFWSNPVPDTPPADNHATNEHPVSGFGHYCTRCHGATQSPGVDDPASRDNEFLFASLRNVEGFPGEPLLFRVDDSWREEATAEAEPAVTANDALLAALGTWIANGKAADAEAEGAADGHGSHPGCTRPGVCDRPERSVDAAFLARFGPLPNAELGDCARLPGVTHDWAPLAPAEGDGPAKRWATSNQCMGCHAGLTAPFGPTMFLPLGAKDDPDRAEYGADGLHQSPFGEWRWTPMGLAGRDPIFLAQLETELAIVKREFPAEQAKALARDLQDACLRCHGAMGQHAFQDDGGPDARFTLEGHAATAAADAHIGLGEDRYGALARDGVSCLVCHRMVPREQPAGDDRSDLRHYLDENTTGNAVFGPPGEIAAPDRDDSLRPYVMHHATGLKPKTSDYLTDSRMCGTCHVVSLPNVDMPLDAHGGPGHEHDGSLAAVDSTPSFRGFHHHVEQATYLEWLNSEFQTEFEGPDGLKNPTGRSCQECHMSDTADGTPDGPKTRSRVAVVQDVTYPDAENLAPHADLTIPVREGYRRHDFSGLNVFLLEMMNQHDDVLGVRKTDFMTGGTNDLPNAIAGMVQTAASKTARLTVTAEPGDGAVTATVRVENLAGHRFPTGVGFRRAFLEVSLVDADGEVVWISGATDATGTLVDAAGEPLPTEFFAEDAAGVQQYQPHHRVVRDPSQVQIYETLLKNHAGRFTTSFVHGCETVKDNRLLPRGWTHDGPSPDLDGPYLAATRPGPLASQDADFTAGDGADVTRYEMSVPDGVDPATCTVRARLFYQATPPYFLRNLFTVMNGPADAEPGPAARRLYALCANLKTEGTSIANWKLPVVAAEAPVR
ncbi:cytochrome P460 family protein [Alienimonas sp. DA493]|uniref:cytochrome P460 family protein n=1 Tax=Alienimonas sp. DA493 TaxID=3373605 RepID=UPI003755359E